MENEILRTYGCKDEELLFISIFVSLSLKRDLPEFTAYSPVFNQAYQTAFDGKIAVLKEVVMPKFMVTERKEVTTRLYGTMDGLLESARHLTGYIKLAKSDISIPLDDFGFAPLRKAVNAKDAEGTFKSLQFVNANVAKFKEVLAAKGLSEDFVTGLIATAASIAADKELQYEYDTKATALLQSNVGLFNELNAQLTEILSVGKILYTGKDPVKLKEYTFSELMKKVRRSSKPGSDDTATDTTTTK
jgi:hypothetical protein